MGASNARANYTEVHVAYHPPRINRRAVMKVTIHIGLVQGEEEHIALQRLLTAIRLLKETAP